MKPRKHQNEINRQEKRNETDPMEETIVMDPREIAAESEEEPEEPELKNEAEESEDYREVEEVSENEEDPETEEVFDEEESLDTEDEIETEEYADTDEEELSDDEISEDEALEDEDPEEEVSEEEESVINIDEESENMPLKKKKGRRRRLRKRAKKKELGKMPWIIAGSIVGGLLVIYLGISLFFIGHFYVNTSINGKDFSGKTVEDVEAYLKEQVEGYELKIIELDDKSDTIKGTDISLVYVENSDVEDALKSQNPLFWISSLFSKSNTDVTIDVGYDEEVLEEQIQSIQAMVQEQTEPVSAYPKFDGNSFVVEPEVLGTAVDKEVLSEKIKEYITNFEPELDMLEEKCYKLPAYTSESPEVQKACDTMNEYCKASITYTMNENVVVDKQLISTWLSCDSSMQVTFNEDAVREWMRQFGETYDTVGATRTITSPSGKTVEVSGGTYGWEIDEETETQNLINSIKNGETATREPAYAQTAATHAAQDWGSTYLEVDLSAQYMWYIVNGSIALQSDVVTGLPTPDRATPSGVYYILYTERNATLVGEKDPATGQPIYETPVAYWMPFTNQGHGFHDATWQPAFGGSLYQSLGSHGCVNMPLDQAGYLFDMVSAGTPVVIHY